MINQIVIAGRLTADSELKTTKTGSNVCNFNIANNRKSATGGEETTFMEVVIFGKYAQIMHPYLKKGVTLDVIGKVVQENWTNNDGKTVRKHKIYAKELDFRTPKSPSQDIPQGVSQEDYEEYYAENSQGEEYE